MASYYWRPVNFSVSGNTPGNWRTAATGGSAHTTLPTNNDDIFFDNNSIGNCEITANMTCRSLHNSGTANLDIKNGATLTIVGSNYSGFVSLWKSGHLHSSGTGTVTMSGGQMEYSSGAGMNNKFTPTSLTLNVFDGAKWIFTRVVGGSTMGSFGCETYVGRGGGNTNGGELHFDRELTSSISFVSGASITVRDDGSLFFFNRSGVSCLNVEIDSAGFVGLGYDSRVSVGVGFTCTDGKLHCYDHHDEVSAGNALITGSVTLCACEVSLTNSVHAPFGGKLTITGSMSITDVTFDMEILADDDNACDYIEVGAGIVWSGTNVMNIFTRNDPPTPGTHNYTLMRSGNDNAGRFNSVNDVNSVGWWSASYYSSGSYDYFGVAM